MKGILADADIGGQWKVLQSRLESKHWEEIWISFGLEVKSFEDLGLAVETADAVVWRLCQERQIVLITGNRNADGPDSLEVTLRAHNTLTSLPVFTLADADRVLNDKVYADRVAEKLLQYLQDMDKILGTGRLYLP